MLTVEGRTRRRLSVRHVLVVDVRLVHRMVSGRREVETALLEVTGSGVGEGETTASRLNDLRSDVLALRVILRRRRVSVGRRSVGERGGGGDLLLLSLDEGGLVSLLLVEEMVVLSAVVLSLRRHHVPRGGTVERRVGEGGVHAVGGGKTKSGGFSRTLKCAWETEHF
jgi:hypothetical protein